MCGICGIRSQLPLSDGLDRLRNMVALLRHRGPDGQGVWLDEGAPQVGLGHTRLAIIAPSEEGAQPMADGAAVIAFNGEIYNYRQLRRELEAQGAVFRSSTDTEVILKAFDAWGQDCVRHLRGIFAFAIWNAQEHRLFLARDPLGVKPLYYYKEKNLLVFASEVRALLASGLVPRELSQDGLDSMLAYGSVQEPYTLIDKVWSLPPAATMTIEADGSVKQETAWQPDFSPLDLDGSQEQARVSQCLRETLELQKISDAPLGVFLSGGIDSSAIAAIMAEQSHDIQAFTVGLEDSELDESADALGTARRLGIRCHRLQLSLEDMARKMERALDAYDQPSIDGLNTWFISSAVADAGMKVALSGLGGDEIFGGYGGFFRPRRLERIATWTRWLPHPLLNALSAIAPREAWKKCLDAGRFALPPYFLTRQVMGHQLRSSLLKRGIPLEPAWMERAFKPLANAETDPVNRLSFWETSTYMRSTLLRDADQMGMANSLEIRVPLVDAALVGLMMRIPGAHKISQDLPKQLLVRAAGIPEEVACRPKRGFVLPMADIVRKTCREEARELFLRNTCPAFDYRVLERLWQQYERGAFPWQRIWTIFQNLRWLKRWNVQ